MPSQTRFDSGNGLQVAQAFLPVSQGLQPAKAHENRPESGNIAAAVSGEIESTVEAVEAVCLSDRSVRFERITGHRCLLWERR